MDILAPSESPLQLLLNSHRWTSAKNSSSPVGVMLPEAREAERSSHYCNIILVLNTYILSTGPQGFFQRKCSLSYCVL